MNAIEKVFRYALDYAHEKMTDTEDVIMNTVTSARAELAALLEENSNLENRNEALNEERGDLLLLVEALRSLLTDLDRLNRMARKEGHGAWSLNDIYQPRIDAALGVLPFTTPSEVDPTKDEVIG